MATQRQIEASRENGRKGGVKTPEGKALSRLNARKHGIFASALTEHDSRELHEAHAELAAWLGPEGPVEEILVEKLALAYVRLQRCARAEAEYHIAAWKKKPSSAYDPAIERTGPHGETCVFRPQEFERAAVLFGRYDTTLTNQFLKLLHEIDRQQRMRRGEGVPPALVAQVTVEGVREGGDGREDALRNEPGASQAT